MWWRRFAIGSAPSCPTQCSSAHCRRTYKVLELFDGRVLGTQSSRYVAVRILRYVGDTPCRRFLVYTYIQYVSKTSSCSSLHSSSPTIDLVVRIVPYYSMFEILRAVATPLSAITETCILETSLTGTLLLRAVIASLCLACSSSPSVKGAVLTNKL